MPLLIHILNLTCSPTVACVPGSHENMLCWRLCCVLVNPMFTFPELLYLNFQEHLTQLTINIPLRTFIISRLSFYFTGYFFLVYFASSSLSSQTLNRDLWSPFPFGYPSSSGNLIQMDVPEKASLWKWLILYISSLDVSHELQTHALTG